MFYCLLVHKSRLKLSVILFKSSVWLSMQPMNLQKNQHIKLGNNQECPRTKFPFAFRPYIYILHERTKSKRIFRPRTFLKGHSWLYSKIDLFYFVAMSAGMGLSSLSSSIIVFFDFQIGWFFDQWKFISSRVRVVVVSNRSNYFPLLCKIFSSKKFVRDIHLILIDILSFEI